MIVTIILDIDGVSHVCRTFEDESIQINKIVSSVDNLGSQGTVTKQSFRLPLIGGLLDAIGDITDPAQSAKVNLNKSIKGRILVDGFERFVGSFFVVNATKGDSKEVEMIFQGNETDLKATLSNITMAELCEGEFVLYNYTEMKQYFDDPSGYRDANGYIFPLVDYGQGFDFMRLFNGLYETDFKAAITIDKCIELMPLNISIDNSLIDLKEQAILLHNDKNFYPKLDTSPLNNTGIIFPTTFRDISLQNPPIKNLITMDAEIAYSNSIKAGDTYQANVDGLHSFSFAASLRLFVTNGQARQAITQFFFVHYSGGNLVQEVGVSWQSRRAIPTGAIYNDDTGTVNFNLKAGDLVSLWIDSRADLTRISSAELTCTAAPAFSPTSRIDVAANCPELTAWDILRTVVIQSNSQIISNSDGTYQITPFNDWIEDNDEVIILDDIIEDGVDVQIKPFSIEGAKSIRLAYKENDDLYSKKYKELTGESFGEKYIENTGTELAKNEFKIELPVATIPTIELNGNTPIPKLVDKDNKTVIGKPLILNTSHGASPATFSLRSIFNNTLISNYNALPFMGNWGARVGGYNQTDSNFGQSLQFYTNVGYPKNTLYERYWKTYLEETYSEQSREIKMNIKLDRNQIDGLKFNEKFYYKNTLLRLVKLEGVSLTSNQPAKATFMKRFKIRPIEIAEYYPYNIISSIVQWKRSSDNADLGDANTQPAADVEASAKAYGFFYDSNRNIATQSGQILIY